MGAPSKSQIEAITDAMAARIQKDIDGFQAEYYGQATASLWDLVDAWGDPYAEAAMMTSALGIDAGSLPESAAVWLQYICNRVPYRDFFSALNTHILSVNGGSYSSLRAYLVDKAAIIHPLAAEVARLTLGGDTIFTSSSVVAGVSNPTYAAIFPERVYVGADGSLAEETTDALDVGTADITLFGSDNHTLYIGCDRKFNTIVVALSTLANTSITPVFSYWNGNAWTTLTVTDNSTGFTKNDTISFTAPTDWTRYYKDAGGTAFADLARLYYVRIARTADTVSTPPVGTGITVLPTVITRSSTDTTHQSIEQPPLGLIRVTAASTVTVTAPTSVDYTRFAHPIGTAGRIRLRALTPLSANITVTLAYTSDAGTTGSAAQSALSTAAAYDTLAVALTSSDGLRAVLTTTTASTSATEGVLALECLSIRTPAI